jgi:hypothetical protein
MDTPSFFDPETSELLQLGVKKYRDIALAERAVDRARDAFEAIRPFPGAQAVEALRNYYATFRDLEDLRQKARSAFAEPMDWVAGAPFSLDELRAGEAAGLAEEDPCCAFMGKGRADFFYTKDGKPSAVAGHSRSTWAACHAFGASQGLEAHALEGSWRSPGGYIAVLYVLPGFVHLPKQRAAS